MRFSKCLSLEASVDIVSTSPCNHYVEQSYKFLETVFERRKKMQRHGKLSINF
jgi:hypothetical protein